MAATAAARVTKQTHSPGGAWQAYRVAGSVDKRRRGTSLPTRPGFCVLKHCASECARLARLALPVCPGCGIKDPIRCAIAAASAVAAMQHLETSASSSICRLFGCVTSRPSSLTLAPRSCRISACICSVAAAFHPVRCVARNRLVGLAGAVAGAVPMTRRLPNATRTTPGLGQNAQDARCSQYAGCPVWCALGRCPDRGPVV